MKSNLRRMLDHLVKRVGSVAHLVPEKMLEAICSRVEAYHSDTLTKWEAARADFSVEKYIKIQAVHEVVPWDSSHEALAAARAEALRICLEENPEVEAMTKEVEDILKVELVKAIKALGALE